MHRRSIWLILGLLIVGFVAGCGGAGEPSGEAIEVPSAEEQAQEAGEEVFEEAAEEALTELEIAEEEAEPFSRKSEELTVEPAAPRKSAETAITPIFTPIAAATRTDIPRAEPTAIVTVATIAPTQTVEWANPVTAEATAIVAVERTMVPTLVIAQPIAPPDFSAVQAEFEAVVALRVQVAAILQWVDQAWRGLPLR